MHMCENSGSNFGFSDSNLVVRKIASTCNLIKFHLVSFEYFGRLCYLCKSKNSDKIYLMIGISSLSRGGSEVAAGGGSFIKSLKR